MKIKFKYNKLSGDIKTIHNIVGNLDCVDYQKVYNPNSDYIKEILEIVVGGKTYSYIYMNNIEIDGITFNDSENFNIDDITNQEKIYNYVNITLK